MDHTAGRGPEESELAFPADREEPVGPEIRFTLRLRFGDFPRIMKKPSPDPLLNLVIISWPVRAQTRGKAPAALDRPKECWTAEDDPH